MNYTQFQNDLMVRGDDRDGVRRVVANDLLLFNRQWTENSEIYGRVADASGLPAALIAALHWRESSGSFLKYLEQGDLLGTRTWADGRTNKGISLPDNTPGTILYPVNAWPEAAINCLTTGDAARNKSLLGIKQFTGDLNLLCEFAERYNGLGYRNKGLNSPYVLSGTTGYFEGKFTDDHKYDPYAIDYQVGVLPMLRMALFPDGGCE